MNITKRGVFKGCSGNRESTCRTGRHSLDIPVRDTGAWQARLHPKQESLQEPEELLGQVGPVRQGVCRASQKRGRSCGLGVGWGSSGGPSVALVPRVIFHFFPANSEIPLRAGSWFCSFCVCDGVAHVVGPQILAEGKHESRAWQNGDRSCDRNGQAGKGRPSCGKESSARDHHA